MARLPGGRVCLLNKGLPGEVVTARITASKRSWAKGMVTEIITPSPYRRPHPCPHGGECGGCPLGVLDYTRQPEIKMDILADTLRHLGVAPVLEPGLVMEPSPIEWGYRHRIRLHLDREGKEGFKVCGSHRIIPIERCQAACHRLNQALSDARVNGTLAPLRRWADELVIATGTKPGYQGIHLVFIGRRSRGKRLKTPRTSLEEAGIESITLAQRRGRRLSIGEPRLPMDLSPASAVLVEPRIVPWGFSQANWPANIKLIKDIIEITRGCGAERVLDLFCGFGNFTLPIASRLGVEAEGVELSKEAVRAASASALASGLDGSCRFKQGDVEADAETIAAGTKAELALLDPPRAGAPRTVRALASKRIPHIIYVSCNPATLSRDLKIMLEAGYQCSCIKGYDLFPHTAHVETLVYLTLTG